MPVYRGDAPGAGVAERRRRFLGWATGQFQAGGPDIRTSSFDFSTRTFTALTGVANRRA